MSSIFPKIIQFAQEPMLPEIFVKSTIILLIAAGFVLLMRRQSAAVRHWIWSLSLFGLLLLPMLIFVAPQLAINYSSKIFKTPDEIISLNQLNDDKPADKYQRRIITGEDPPVLNTFTSENFKESSQKFAETDVPSNTSSTHSEIQKSIAKTEVSASKTIGFSTLIFLLWLVGCIIKLGMTGLINLRTWLQIRNGKEIHQQEWQNCIRKTKNRLEIQQEIKIIINPQIRVPAIWGFFKPVLLLPETAFDWSSEKRQIVVIHELAHLKRRDFLINWVAQIVSALYWINPVVRISIRQYFREQEYACDDYVLRDGVESCDYAQCLLEIARSLSGKRVLTTGSIPMANKSDLKGRIENILSTKLPRHICHSKTALLSALGLAFIVLPITIFTLRGQSGDNLPQPIQPLSVSQLINNLKNGNNSVQETAAWALGDREDERAVPALVEALKNSDSGVRGMAAWALGEIKDKRSLDPLLDALGDENDYAKEMIIRAIGELEPERAVVPLVRNLADPNPDIRYAVIWSLGEIHSGPAIEAVVNALNDPAVHVREMAVNVLGRVGNERNAQTLFPLLKDPESRIRARTAFALGRIDSKTAVGPLLNALNDPVQDVQIEAVRALGKIGDSRAVQPLLNLMHNTQPEVRAIVVWSLDEIKGH